MKYNLISLFFLFFSSQINSQILFEGKLTYHHEIKLLSKGEADISKSKEAFDSLVLFYKNRNFIKSTNKKSYEKIIFIDSIRKEYVIYKDPFSKSKKLSMNEDNLNFGKFYLRKNSHFGQVISTKLLDTTILFNSKKLKMKTIFLERKYGNEVYVYSYSINVKIADNRNLLRNMGEQVHPDEIADIINGSILFYYKMQLKSNKNAIEEYKLIGLDEARLSVDIFKIPKHKDAKGLKKENKKDGRYKFYQIIN